MNKSNYYYIHNTKFFLLIIIAVLFMSMGYASINSISLGINGDVLAYAQDGIFITDYVYKESSNANVGESSITSISGTFLNTDVVLSSDSNNTDSYITYTITVYNSTGEDYFFEQVKDGSEGGFSNYTNITYENTLVPGDIVRSNDYKTFDVTFKYVEGVVPSEAVNKLVSSLNYIFKPVSTLLDNITVSVPTTGKFQNINTVLTHNLVITNNNLIPIKVKVDSDSTESINYSSSALESSINASSNVTVPITLKPVSGFVYLGDITSVILNIDLVHPCNFDIDDIQIDIDTYGSPFTEIITLYNIYNTTPNFLESVTTEANSGVFKTADSGGTAQYFRGVIKNNYVSFGGHLWRVVRLNSDGTLRLVLNSPIGAPTTYYYSSSSSTNTTFNNSNAEAQITNWYSSNLLSNYNSYINQKAIFFHDRRNSVDTSLNIYRTWNRLFGLNNNGVPYPTINTSGLSTTYLYTKTGSGIGNGYLTYPVGLLTADEIMFAGGTITTSSTSALPGSVETSFKPNFEFFIANDVPQGVGMWTMSPFSSTAMMVFKTHVGFFRETPASQRLLKPVIELNSGLLFEGHGTETEPYIIYE